MQCTRPLLFFFFWLTAQTLAQAQPGPFGGTLSFRLFHKGKNVAHDSSYKVTLHYEGLKYRFYKTVLRDSKRLWFEAEETPVGGILPNDFSICIAHLTDTMQLLGAEKYASMGLDLDSVPFLKGRYLLPDYFFSNLKVAPGIRMLNFGWPCQNVEAPCKVHTYLPEKVSHLPLIAGAAEDITVITTDSSYLVKVKDTNTPVWRTVFAYQRHRNKFFPLQVKVAQHGQTLVVHNSNMILVSLDHGNSWRCYWPDEMYSPKDNGGGRIRNFFHDTVFFAGNQLYARAQWQLSEFGVSVIKHETFRLHLDTDQNPEFHKALLAKAEKDMANLMDSALAAGRQKMFTNVMAGIKSFKSYHRPNYLKKVTLFQYQGYYLTVISLNNGSYNMSQYLLLPYKPEKRPICFSEGTYIVNDSTITFNEQKKLFVKGVDPLVAYFRPQGLYYYYWGQNYIDFYKFHEKYPEVLSRTFRPSLKTEEELIEEVWIRAK